MSRTSQGDQKLAELRTSLDDEYNADQTEFARLEKAIAAVAARMQANRIMRGKLGDVAVKRVRKSKTDNQGSLV